MKYDPEQHNIRPSGIAGIAEISFKNGTGILV